MGEWETSQTATTPSAMLSNHNLFNLRKPVMINSQVNSCTIVEFNLLAYLARQDKTPYVAFLLEQG